MWAVCFLVVALLSPGIRVASADIDEVTAETLTKSTTEAAVMTNADETTTESTVDQTVHPILKKGDFLVSRHNSSLTLKICNAPSSGRLTMCFDSELIESCLKCGISVDFEGDHAFLLALQARANAFDLVPLDSCLQLTVDLANNSFSSAPWGFPMDLEGCPASLNTDTVHMRVEEVPDGLEILPEAIIIIQLTKVVEAAQPKWPLVVLIVINSVAVVALVACVIVFAVVRLCRSTEKPNLITVHTTGEKTSEEFNSPGMDLS